MGAIIKATMDSKTKISNAAIDLFTKKGIKGTTTKELARSAGIAEGTIYKHFKSKNDLALKLFLNYMDLFRIRLIESASNYSNPQDKLKALIKAFFDFAREEAKAYHYIMVGHHTELSRVPRARLKPKDIFVELIREGVEKGEFRKIDENIGAALITGMITRAILFLDIGVIKKDYNQVVSEVIEASLRVLKA
jgi:AcrR family transcriptional regulator